MAYWIQVTPLWTLRTTSRSTSLSILLENETAKCYSRVENICKKYISRPVKLFLGAMFCKLENFQQGVAHCTTVTGLRKYRMEVGEILDVSLVSFRFLWTTQQVQVIPLLGYQEPRPNYLKIGSHDVEVQRNYQNRRGQTDWQPSRGFNIFSFHLPTANSIHNCGRLRIMRRTDRYNLPVSSSAVCPRINQTSA